MSLCVCLCSLPSLGLLRFSFGIFSSNTRSTCGPTLELSGDCHALAEHIPNGKALAGSLWLPLAVVFLLFFV